MISLAFLYRGTTGVSSVLSWKILSLKYAMPRKPLA